MALRLIEMVLPGGYKEEVDNLLAEQELLDIWEETIAEGRLHIKIIVPTGQSENILDLLEKRFTHVEGFRIILLPVEASLPRPKPEEKPLSESGEAENKKKSKPSSGRISREELYSDVTQTAQVSWVFVLLMVLSSVVASVGILRNNVAFIIGAMVIAPVLGPNVALSLATTLGDIDLSRRAVRTVLVGVCGALVFSVALGLVLYVDPAIPELVSRTEVNLGDIALALAAGSAAALSFTSGLLSALIGVMVAVALLPPLVALGLLVGSGYWEMALGALLLTLTNLICVNLAGVVTFLAQGIRPLSWWEANKAKRAAQRAILIWTLMLVALAVIILLAQRN